MVDAPEKITELAADTLRAWALDEDLKRRVMSTPALAGLAAAVAGRYTAGDTADDAIAAARAGLARGHLASIDYAGESVRDAELARRETDVFLALAAAIGRAGIPATVSSDLSQVGSVVDRDLGLRHAREIAEATAPLGDGDDDLGRGIGPHRPRARLVRDARGRVPPRRHHPAGPAAPHPE
jgi:proline dehydrogenase